MPLLPFISRCVRTKTFPRRVSILISSDYMGGDDHDIRHATTNPPSTPGNPETTSSSLKSTNGAGTGGGGGGGSSTTSTSSKEQDRFLPIANVGRIMKKVIPGNGKISKDAKETVQECVSEFISFVTGEASDKCQREKRKTINGEDIIWAITTLGFEDYVSPLKQYLSKYKEIEGEKLNIPKQHRSDQRLQVQQEQDQSLPYPTTVYSSTTLISQPPFVAAADHHQPFPLPFSPDSIQKQLQQQEHFDSGGRW